jgi:hypothetical protein
MKYTKITKWEQINRLKKGDQVIVCWSKNSDVYRLGKSRIQLHTVIEVRREQREVILSGKHNPWFGIKNYLLGRSVANSVSLVEV